MQVIKVTTTGLIHTGHIIIEGMTLVPAAATATVVLNDSLDGSGDDKGGAKTGSNCSIDQSLYGQRFSTGIYVTLAGAGAKVYIYLK